MGINISWDIYQKNTLVCQFNGIWTWHQCREAMQVVMYMQDGLSQPIAYIYDLTNSTLETRACLNRVQKLLQLQLQPAPQQIIIVDKPMRLTSLETMLRRTAQAEGNLHFAENLTAARRLIDAA